MTFKLNCAPPAAGRFKNGVRNVISVKIGRQMGAAIKMPLLHFRHSDNGPFKNDKLPHCYYLFAFAVVLLDYI